MSSTWIYYGSDLLYLFGSTIYVGMDWVGVVPVLTDMPALGDPWVSIMYTLAASVYVVMAVGYWIAFELNQSLDELLPCCYVSGKATCVAAAHVGRAAELTNFLASLLYFFAVVLPLLGGHFGTDTYVLWVASHSLQVIVMFFWIISALLYLGFNIWVYYEPSFHTDSVKVGLQTLWRSLGADLTRDASFWSDILNVFASTCYLGASILALYMYFNVEQCDSSWNTSSNQDCVDTLNSMLGDGSLAIVRLIQVHGDYAWFVGAWLLIVQDWNGLSENLKSVHFPRWRRIHSKSSLLNTSSHSINANRRPSDLSPSSPLLSDE